MRPMDQETPVFGKTVPYSGFLRGGGTPRREGLVGGSGRASAEPGARGKREQEPLWCRGKGSAGRVSRCGAG